MFELPEDLKKISAGKIIEVQKKQKNPSSPGLDQRGRREQTEDDENILDKGAKRAAKKRRQKERKREEKQQALEEAKMEKEKEKKSKQQDNKPLRPNTGKFKKSGGTTLARQNESGSKRNTRHNEDIDKAAAEEWSLKNLSHQQMSLLNAKLDEYQECPRNLSEPIKRYVPSPDFRPESLEQADEEQQELLLA